MPSFCAFNWNVLNDGFYIVLFTSSASTHGPAIKDAVIALIL